MQKLSRPDAVYVVTILAVVLGLLLVRGGVGFIVSSVWYPDFLFVGVVVMLVGILDIGVGAGFYYAWPGSRTVGIIASLVTGILSTLRTSSGSVPFSLGLSVVSPFAILYPLAVVYSLTRMNVRTYFANRPSNLETNRLAGA